MLHPSVCGGSTEGILTVHSLSKRSNLAGYRCAFVAGDPALVGELLAVRKNLGLQMPGPAAGGDDRGAGRRRRTSPSSTPATPPAAAKLREALESAGFRIDHSEASLYLWADAARRGLLGHRLLAGRPRHPRRPRHFYGRAGARHVRVAFTATDERIDAAVRRLAG